MIGVFLTIRTDAVVTLVARAERSDGRRLWLTSLGIFALVIIIGLAVSTLRSGNNGEPWFPNHKGVEVNRVFIPKETNTIDAGYWHNTPGWQLPTCLFPILQEWERAYCR
jgi:hypothetical protein